MFQFSAFASFRIVHLQCTGFPHSDMYGSPDICSSPYLFAAYHVLLRLSKPRHPLCALSNLSNSCVKFFLFTTSINSNMSMNFVSHSIITLITIKQLNQWRITDSNRWPPACKAGALASWANPPKKIRVRMRARAMCTNSKFSKLRSSPKQIWTADPYIISVVL